MTMMMETYTGDHPSILDTTGVKINEAAGILGLSVAEVAVLHTPDVITPYEYIGLNDETVYGARVQYNTHTPSGIEIATLGGSKRALIAPNVRATVSKPAPVLAEQAVRTEASGLAENMKLKNASEGFGGAKSVESTELTPDEKIEVVPRAVTSLFDAGHFALDRTVTVVLNDGTIVEVPHDGIATDIGTGPDDQHISVDTLTGLYMVHYKLTPDEALRQARMRFNGLAPADGGLAIREISTGDLAYEAMDGAVKHNPLLSDLNDRRNTGDRLRIGLEGHGKVGYHFADAAIAGGYDIASLKDFDGVLIAKPGFSIDHRAVHQARLQGKSLDEMKFEGVEYFPDEELFWSSTSQDIIVPAAKGGTLNVDTAKLVPDSVRLVAPPANAGVTQLGKEAAMEKGIVVHNDGFTGRGGVITSYAEFIKKAQGIDYSQEQEAKILRGFRKETDMLTQAIARKAKELGGGNPDTTDYFQRNWDLVVTVMALEKLTGRTK